MNHRDEFRAYGEEMAARFEKNLLAAAKKASKSFGTEIVKEQRANLRADGSGSRRQKGVRSIVGRDGTLVFLDHAPLARAQEDGDTVNAQRGWLAIGRAGQSLGKPGSKVPGAFTVHTKSGATLLVVKGPDGKLENLATLVHSVTIRNKLGFRKLISARFPQYIHEISELVQKSEG